MTAHTPETLHARASKLTQAAASIVIAQSHLSAAVTSSAAARADLAILSDLNTAYDATHRVIKRAELQRQRLLRKADRLTRESTP